MPTVRAPGPTSRAGFRSRSEPAVDVVGQHTFKHGALEDAVQAALETVEVVLRHRVFAVAVCRHRPRRADGPAGRCLGYILTLALPAGASAEAASTARRVVGVAGGRSGFREVDGDGIAVESLLVLPFALELALLGFGLRLGLA